MSNEPAGHDLGHDLGHDPGHKPGLDPGAVLDCGWGRLIFAQTFGELSQVADAMRDEAPDRRDIAFYVSDPHVLLAISPQELFLDPSHTFRLPLQEPAPAPSRERGFVIRKSVSDGDADEINRLYEARQMVPIRPDHFQATRDDRVIVRLVAEDEVTGAILGTVTGIDHVAAFGDPEGGSSLWCLAVDAQSSKPGIGQALVRRLIELFKERGRAFLDLSVMHDNRLAISLYTKLGFKRIPYFAVKRKNPINEKLFVGERPEKELNPYATLIVNQARWRGINVEVVDAEGGFFRLTFGARSILCRESLSELTTGVAVSICDDKAVTRRLVERAGVRVPAQIEAGDEETLRNFLQEHGRVVVKPARGEQGRGVSVGLETAEEVLRAVEQARAHCDRVLVEALASGDDLRLIVIDFRLVAAAIRKPARVIGDGSSTVRELIEAQSKRRAAATGGESSIPMDAETERCVRSSGSSFDAVLGEGQELAVRKTANLHTGGTIHDVTDHVHPELVSAAVKTARAINIPVVGVDLIVKSPLDSEYAFIEANERPGLANHEPQPTAERFVDLLFPLSIPEASRASVAGRPHEGRPHEGWPHEG